LAFETPFFNEFAIRCPVPAAEVNAHLLDSDILGGFELGRTYEGMDDMLLVAVTEMISKAEIDYLTAVLAEVNNA
jgi:glycine dehydrogenase subunit 1